MGKKQAPKKEFIRTNYKIKSLEVRLVGDNVDTGIYDTKKAIKIAEEMGLDLIEISRGDMPICKIMDFGKYQYDQKKKKKENFKKQKENSQKVKEIQFGPNTDEHDFLFKKKHAENFLNDNNIVKAVVFFKGRERQFGDKGKEILLRLVNDLLDIGNPDNIDPKMEGNKMIINIRPKKTKIKDGR